ncbi:MAG TPA: hypothetical protein VJB95_00435 [Candidatus Paceibacterota bacterium]
MKKKIFKYLNIEICPAKQDGYTILETMIAISLFLIIITAGMGALLNANLLHQKSQDMASLMDNLSFILEDMSRNLRTGYDYHCINDGNFAMGTIVAPRSCASGGAIAFEYAFGNNTVGTDQWVYKIESNDGGATYNVLKSVDGAQSFVQLNPPEVAINSVSGFSVLGAEAPGGNLQQPFVIIKLVGTITYKNVTTPFSLQTSASQRTIDI